MEKLEDLLPGIEKFMRSTLARESLSKEAEKRRQYFLERLDIIQLPPHLPPKPDGADKTVQMQGRKLPEPVANVSNGNNSKNSSSDDFIAQQRAISRQTANSASSTGDLQQQAISNPVPNDGLGIDSDQYEEGLYEEPVPMDSNLSEGDSGYPSAQLGAASAAAATFELESDAESSTSYESYDEPDLDEPYNNVGYDGQVKTDIPLPRLKTKRKKKKAVTIHDRYYKQLLNVTHEGELYHRGRIAFTSSWTKRYCAVCDGIFYCYKDNKESKPVFSLQLLGYDVIQQDREKGRSNVLRLSHPGCETHFLSTDSVSETQSWFNRIEAVCNTIPDGTELENTNPKLRTGSISSMETYTDNPSSLVNGSPHMKNRKTTASLSSDGSGHNAATAAAVAAMGGKREKKGKIGKFLSETFGKKKGRAAAHQLEITGGELLDRNSVASPDIAISGLVKLNSPALLGEDHWQHRYCAIRHGVFECFKDDSTSSDLEFSLLLSDYELLAHAPEKDSLSLTVTRQGEVAFIIEPENKLDQGDWLSAMLKLVGNGGVPQQARVEPDDDDPAYDDEEMAYTYVDHRELRGVMLPESLQRLANAHGAQRRASEDERLYADLNDKSAAPDEDDRDSNHSSANDHQEEDEGDTYDEPPLEQADRSSKVYEEVSEAPTNHKNHSDRSPAILSHTTTENQRDDNQDEEAPDRIKPTEKFVHKLEKKVNKTEKQTDRQTRADIQTKAELAASPTPSTDSIRQTFSRESSCSSEGSSKKLSETIARNRALFENNSNAGSTTQKWPGYKLAGANHAAVKRTPSLSSTASTKSTPNNSAASSPKTARANPSTLGTVDRFKAAFEPNNNTVSDKRLSPSPNTQRKVNQTQPINQPQPDIKPAAGTVSNSPFSKITQNKTAGRISPIRITAESKEEKPPPKFTSIFQAPVVATTKNNSASTTTTVHKPKLLNIKAPTPYVAPSNGQKSSEGDKDKLSINPDVSALSKFAATEGTSQPVSKTGAAGNSATTYKYSSESEEQQILDKLRLKQTSLREERKKIRDQKLSTMLPESIEKLNAEYKRVDTEYKTVHKEIEILEDRKLQRIKGNGKESIERRRSDADSRSIVDKKKMWEKAS